MFQKQRLEEANSASSAMATGWLGRIGLDDLSSLFWEKILSPP